MFQIDKSEEVTEGPTFFEKGLKLTDQPAQKIIVTQFQHSAGVTTSRSNHATLP